MNINDILNQVTIAQAKEYAALEDKYVYCLDIMGMSADQQKADDFVERLESHFESMLKADVTIASIEDFRQVGQYITFMHNDKKMSAGIVYAGHCFNGTMDFDVQLIEKCEYTKRESMKKLTVNSSTVIKYS